MCEYMVVLPGNRGTDHGHGNAMLVMGAGVKGGHVYGKWPGLAQDQLYDGRDLAVTTDFRDVFAEIVTRHLGVVDAEPIFPGYALDRRERGRFIGLKACATLAACPCPSSSRRRFAIARTPSRSSGPARNIRSPISTRARTAWPPRSRRAASRRAIGSRFIFRTASSTSTSSSPRRASASSWCPINVLYREREAGHILSDASPKAL